MKQRRARIIQGQELGSSFPRLLGERLCLDFANTIEAPLSAPLEFLTDYTALVRWARHAGLLTMTQVEQLSASAQRQPAAAEAAFAQALALRAATQRAFAAIATGDEPAPRDLATMQRVHVAGLSQARLAARHGRFDWAWPDVVEPHLDSLLWPIARSAIDLLTAGDFSRIKQCSGPDGCGWLFYDTSKNASRRWCSMEGCGSHAKMRRYNARKRVAQH